MLHALGEASKFRLWSKLTCDLLTGKFAVCERIPVVVAIRKLARLAPELIVATKEISTTCGHASCDRGENNTDLWSVKN